MYPHERSLVKELKDRPFALIGVNSDASPEFVKQVSKEKQLTWRSFFDGGGTDGPISTQWNVRGWPTIFVLDHKGVIRFKGMRGDPLDAAIHELLKEAEGS